MTRRREIRLVTEGLPVAMASGGRPRGKRGRRITVTPAEPADEAHRELTPAEWEVYHQGEPASSVHGPARRSFPLGSPVTRSQLGLAGCDWNDPRYRRAYQDYVILAEPAPSVREGEAVLIERDEDGRVRSGIFLIGPGKERPDTLNQALTFYEGDALRILQAYDRRLGCARAWMTEEMREALERHGFELTEEGEEDEVRTWLVQPGRMSARQLNAYLKARHEKDFEALFLFSSDVGFAVVKATRKRAAGIARRGFHIEEWQGDEHHFRVP